MTTVLTPGEAAALPSSTEEESQLASNRGWEVDHLLALERSESRAWRVAAASLAAAVIGIAAVFAQGPLRRIIEVPIVVDRVTGETTIQQRLSEETVPMLEALDKHNLAAFVRARESYNWMFLQRDFDQVARMAVPVVFNEYGRQFEGPDALQKRLAGTQDWRIDVVAVRLAATRRQGNEGEASVTYDKTVRQQDRGLPDVRTRHVAGILYRYQPQVLVKESDRIENPFGFVVTAYRSDPEIGPAVSGARP